MTPPMTPMDTMTHNTLMTRTLPITLLSSPLLHGQYAGEVP